MSCLPTWTSDSSLPYRIVPTDEGLTNRKERTTEARRNLRPMLSTRGLRYAIVTKDRSVFA